MRFTLIFGTPVQANNSQLGKLSRIIVNNGIANQITVDPGLLRSERVVPINVFQQSDQDTLNLDITDDDWKAYSAFTMNQPLSEPDVSAADPAIIPPDLAFNRQPGTGNSITPEPVVERRTVDQLSVVLTSSTTVVDDAAPETVYKLRGITIDTGRPQELLIEDGRAVPYTAVTLLDEDRIHVGGMHQQPLLASDRGYEQTRANDPAGDQRR